ncbi:hypothetical protein J7J55_01685 [Candidatus Bipolaricaulota bacterium]|jgi:hypothetical protein|nr:hypothetical protein [Candidatus Bipolaricaulota bacterium]
MKRLIILLVAAATVAMIGTMAFGDTAIGGNSASLSPVVTWNVSGWIILYIPHSDMTVDLGTIDGNLYDPETGTWTPLVSSTKNAYVFANRTYTLTLSAASTGTETADLTRFEVKGGDLTAFTPLDSDQTMATGGAGITHIDDIQYEYIPSFDDAPGDYAVTVTYTVTAP